MTYLNDRARPHVEPLAAELEAPILMPLDLRQEIGGTHWDQKHKGPTGQNMALAATLLDLGATMRENPHLKVLSLNGYYDMATPFFGAEYDLSHMAIGDHGGVI